MSWVADKLKQTSAKNFLYFWFVGVLKYLFWKYFKHIDASHTSILPETRDFPFSPSNEVVCYIRFWHVVIHFSIHCWSALFLALFYVVGCLQERQSGLGRLPVWMLEESPCSTTMYAVTIACTPEVVQTEQYKEILLRHESGRSHLNVYYFNLLASLARDMCIVV